MHKKIDRIDLNILNFLQEEGRLSNVQLANRINLSTSPCLERVKRLEKENYITGYKANLNASKLGFNVIAYIQVTLNRSTRDVFDDFKRAVLATPEIEECNMVAGGFDYIVKLRFSSMDQYRDILGRVVTLPGVAQTNTYTVIEQIKKTDTIPIGLLKI